MTPIEVDISLGAGVRRGSKALFCAQQIFLFMLPILGHSSCGSVTPVEARQLEFLRLLPRALPPWRPLQSPLRQRDPAALPRGDLGRLAANMTNLGSGSSSGVKPQGAPPQSPTTPSRDRTGSPRSLPDTPSSSISTRSRNDWSERRKRKRRGEGRGGGGGGGGDGDGDDDGDGDGDGNGGGGGGGDPPGSPSGGGEGLGIMQGMDGVVIWGTNVNVNESMARFRQFLLEFCLQDDDEPLYRSQLEEIHRTQVTYRGLERLIRRHVRRMLLAKIRCRLDFGSTLHSCDRIVWECELTPSFQSRQNLFLAM